MTALDHNPSTLSLLSPINFAMSIERCPNVNWFIQKINLPGISLTPTEYATPMLGLPEVGDHMTWGNLILTYKVDEDFNSWFEIFNWLTGIATFNNSDQYNTMEHQPLYSGHGIKSDISLIVLDSNRNPNFTIQYHDAYPINLSSLNFDTTQADIQYLGATVVFKYDYYSITKEAKAVQ